MRALGRWIWRWALRALAALLLTLAALLAPVAWAELACRGTPVAARGAPLIADPAWHRPASRTLLTFPEWQIVYAYEEYAEVIAAGDPHDFGFLRAIRGFWGPLCPLKRAAMEMGPVTTDTRLTIYTIGVSFTAEMLLKAAYEETLGRLATSIRGEDRAAADDLTAAQAAAYAEFLRQVPWYRYDFAAGRAALLAAPGHTLRDRERRFAIGTEYAAKSAYAGLIAQAVAGIGPDALRMRSVVRGIPRDELRRLPQVEVVGPAGGTPGAVLIETPRYRAFTDILVALAAAGAEMVEVAGNDRILVSTLSPDVAADGTLASLQRQGFGDWRHLRLVPVTELLGTIRTLDRQGERLEHVYDY